MEVIAKMKSRDISVNWGELKSDKVKNFRERIWFIKYWVDYIKTHPDAEWSKGHADFIDAQFQMADRFWKELKEKNPEKFEEMKRLRLGIKHGETSQS